MISKVKYDLQLVSSEAQCRQMHKPKKLPHRGVSQEVGRKFNSQVK